MASNLFWKKKLCRVLEPIKRAERKEFTKLPEPIFCYLTKKRPATGFGHANQNVGVHRCLLSWNRGDGHFVGNGEGANVTLSSLRKDLKCNIYIKKATLELIRDCKHRDTSYYTKQAKEMR